MKEINFREKSKVDGEFTVMTFKEMEEAENCTCYAANGKCSKDVYDI